MSLCFRKIDVLQGTAEEISKATGNKVKNCRPTTIVLNKHFESPQHTFCLRKMKNYFSTINSYRDVWTPSVLIKRHYAYMYQLCFNRNATVRFRRTNHKLMFVCIMEM